MALPGSRRLPAGAGAALALLLAMAACDDSPPKGASGTGANAPPRAATAPWFVEVTESAGVDFVSRSFVDEKLWLPGITGGGMALFDAEGDGDLDLYLVECNESLPAGGDGAEVTHRFYRQVAPLRFEEATAASGLGDRGFGLGVATGDVDNDGDIDLYLCNFGPDQLYRNRGDGTFEDRTADSGLDGTAWTIAAAFLDYDRDGFLDLYVSQYVEFDPSLRCKDNAGRPDFCGPKAFKPARDFLYRNDGDGTFTDVSEAAGIRAVAYAGMGVVTEDFDDDGWPDLYVANDGYQNCVWMNQRNGTFRDDGIVLGAAYNLYGQAEASMGVVLADLDRDGTSDLFLTHLAMEKNTFYRNLGSGGEFIDDTGAVGLAASSMESTGFGNAALDIELDGDLDIAVANGRVSRTEPKPGCLLGEPWSFYAEPNLLYTNDGKGVFALARELAPDFVDRIEVSRGLLAGDLDDDGDLDLILTNLESPTRIFRNDAPRQGSWLRVRAVDPALGGRDAVGARVMVRDGERTLVRTVSSAIGYATAGPHEVHFGIVRPPATILVRWPSGDREEFDLPGVDRELVLRRGEGRRAP